MKILSKINEITNTVMFVISLNLLRIFMIIQNVYEGGSKKKGSNYGFFYIGGDIFRRKDAAAKLFTFPNNIDINLCRKKDLK